MKVQLCVLLGLFILAGLSQAGTFRCSSNEPPYKDYGGNIGYPLKFTGIDKSHTIQTSKREVGGKVLINYQRM